MTFNPDIIQMNIEEQEKEIKKTALTNKQLLRNFLEGFIIDDGKAINDYIIYHMLSDIEKDEKDNYTYWIDGGLSWLLWYNDRFGELSDEEKMSLTTGYLKFHYVINKDYKTKINEIYEFVKELKTKINLGLTDFGFEVDIAFHNINLNTDDTLDFIYDIRTLFKEPTFNIRLIIKKKSVGGARPPRKIKRKQGVFKKLANTIGTLRQEEFIIDESLFEKLKEDAFNGKIILDFRFEYFHQNEKKEFKMDEFKFAYLYRSVNKTYKDDNLKLLNRQKLNRLNEMGMITYCLLNLSAIDDEFGLNVDKYRQQLFFKKKQNIPQFLEELLRIYDYYFQNFKSHNAFFIDKINEIIEKYKSHHYENFKDFVDKWFMSMFRPSINSFILEINEELFREFGVKLFIAGGDAMRRYENDISFTKDIDTKLYIGDIKKEGKTDEEIKAEIVSIIVKHIVKLRNYLEQNIQTIFQPLLKYDKRKNNKGTKVLTFKTSDNRIFGVDILLDDLNKTKFQQFRTRENKKRVDFPVDLYSIDFRTFIGIYDDKGNLIGKKKSHDISLLDVVLQDKDNYYPWYSTEVDGIPVASLEFLLEDFYKTYHMDDRALARISSGKVKKDIERFKKIKELYESRISPNKNNRGILEIPNIDKVIELLKKNRDIIEPINFNLFNEFLMKIKNKQTITILDIAGIISIFQDKIIQFILSKFPELKTAIMDMIFFKKNIYNEELSLLTSDYNGYMEDDDEFRQGYYKLFSHLCSIKDGLVRHVLMFANNKLKADLNKIIPSLKKRPRTTTKLPSQPPKKQKRNTKKSSSPKQLLQPSITTRSGRVIKPPTSLHQQPPKNQPPKSLPPPLPPNPPLPPPRSLPPNYPPPPLPPYPPPPRSLPPNYPPPPLPPYPPPLK